MVIFTVNPGLVQQASVLLICIFIVCIYFQLVERENKEAEDQNLHQTVELYEARCEIARLRSLLPNDNIRSEKDRKSVV